MTLRWITPLERISRVSRGGTFYMIARVAALAVVLAAHLTACGDVPPQVESALAGFPESPRRTFARASEDASGSISIAFEVAEQRHAVRVPCRETGAYIPSPLPPCSSLQYALSCRLTATVLASCRCRLPSWMQDPSMLSCVLDLH
jgi:hypothetical protein